MQKNRRFYYVLAACAALVAGAVWLAYAYVTTSNLARLKKLEQALPAMSADSCLSCLDEYDGAFLSGEGRALCDLLRSRCLFAKGEWAEADSLSREALHYFDFYTWDSARIARIYVLRGCIKREQRNWLAATDAFVNAKEYGCCMKDDAGFGYRANLHLAHIYEKNDLSEESLACLEDALSAAYRLGGGDYLCEPLTRLARHYMAAGDYRKALAYHDTLLHHLPLSECVRRRRCLEGMAHIRLHLADTRRARALLDSAAAVGDTLSARWYVLRGEMFEQEGRPDSAEACFARVLRARSPRHAIRGYEGLFRLASRAGDYREATARARDLLATKDSVSRERLERWADQLQTLHDYQQNWEKAEDEEYHMVVRVNRLYRALAVSLLVVGVAVSLWLCDHKRRLKAENKLLQEMAARERERRGQDELRLNYYKQLNLLTLPIAYGNLREGRVRVGEKEWTMLYENTDACFTGFTSHLRRSFPHLKEDDIRLCCLLKMEMPMELIALVFGIEKASVSQRKQRLCQKMELDGSLDDFILNQCCPSR